jgi:OmpA-OmpF porin, OOP family
MKKIILLQVVFFALLMTVFSLEPCNAQIWKKISQKVKETASNHVVNDAGNATDKTIDKAEHPNVSNGNNSNSNQNSSSNNNSASVSDNSSSDNSSSAAPTIESYKNYDFVPGDSIIFADDFSDDQVGELPAHWLLCYGQGQVNEFEGKKVFTLTTGERGDAATVLQPRMKKKSGYMPAAFTVEFDMYSPFTTGKDDFRDPWVGLNFYGDDNPVGGYSDLNIGPNGLGFNSTLYTGGRDLPGNSGNENFVNKWHHVAIAYRDGQMKIYLDQNRLYVIPQVTNPDMNKFAVRVSGKALVTNIRLAEGGGMSMIQKKFTEAKIVTHGITFDVDKADIKPESMGTLNMIVNVLKNNPDVKFEIDGHTDNTGDAAHNLTLSQQRADAVKVQLVKMGIDNSRLTTKGFGDSKPLSDNSTPEGKANNRRVEFVKI